VAEGKSNKDVEDLLNLSVYTVETHRAHFLQKLALHTDPDLILYAVRKRSSTDASPITNDAGINTVGAVPPDMGLGASARV
jgi:hypothetical protein